MNIPKLLAEARKLDAEATKGPWEYTHGFYGWDMGIYPVGVDDKLNHAIFANNGHGNGDPSDTNAAFIAAARTLLPQLADALEAAGRCTTCDGHPHASGRVCICGGSGRRSEETLNMRQALQAAESRLAKVRERAIIHANETICEVGGRNCCGCSLGPGEWHHDEPERHAPDCPARPMEDA